MTQNQAWQSRQTVPQKGSTSGLVSTEQVPARERVSFWREAVCETFVELECGDISPTNFFGSVNSQSLSDIQFSAVRSAPHSVARTRKLIARSADDYFLISLQTEGVCILQQDGRSAVLRAGDFVLYDTTRAYDLHFNGMSSQLVLRLPRALVSGSLADAECFTAKRVDGYSGTGRLASTFIRQLHDNLQDFDDASLARLQASTIDLMATALAEQSGAIVLGSESRIKLRRRVLAYVDLHLGDHGLTCANVAAAHRISERYLRKVFEDSSLSISEWIWTRRLEKARRDLADPLLAHVQVTAIGYDAGFKDAAHFSRAFKGKFNITPSQYRQMSALPRR